MKIVSLVLLAFLSLFGFFLSAQVSIGGIPPSFQHLGIASNIGRTAVPKTVLPAMDLSEIRKEDSINDLQVNSPYRFGIAREVNLGLENSGRWDTLENGARIWRLKIISTGAESINLNYDIFYMPTGAQFFVYNHQKEILGAFTSINNKTDSIFATMPISGDEILLEYFEPANVEGQGKLHVNQVVHRYRGLKSGNKAFNSSGACNINVNCPEGKKWQDEKRAVAKIMANNNTSICTGTLLNNVRQDGTPYFLTAAHCGPLTNSIFVFGYESAACQPSFNDTNVYSIVGASQLAFDSFTSDFQLMRLSLTPPDSFNVYYAGWSAKPEAPLSSTVIHHPQGDVKKISFDFDSAESSLYPLSPVVEHWQVVNYEGGTTEPGSSGSALFNEKHQVVGQLHGGGAGCGNLNSDWYGKFSDSWLNGPTPSKQLKYWLDPDSTGALTMHAYDPDSALFALDAEILSIGNFPEYSCNNEVHPYLILKNKGNNNIYNLKIKYEVENILLDSILWTGNIPSLAAEKINFGKISLPYGNHDFVISILSLNGSADQMNTNDTLQKSYLINSVPVEVYFTLKTDDYGSETLWLIKEPVSGLTLYEGGPYEEVTGGEIMKDTLCLYDSCFNFIIKDRGRDGFNNPLYGNGYYLISDTAGDTLAFNNNFTSSMFVDSFCLLGTSGLEEIAQNSIDLRIYPNPVRGSEFSIETSEKLLILNMYNIQGQLIKSWSEQELSGMKKLKLNIDLPSGMFVFMASSQNGSVAQEKVLIF